jgi:hypothetical protein
MVARCVVFPGWLEGDRFSLGVPSTWPCSGASPVLDWGLSPFLFYLIAFNALGWALCWWGGGGGFFGLARENP